jgi:hypothetical protein
MSPTSRFPLFLSSSSSFIHPQIAANVTSSSSLIADSFSSIHFLNRFFLSNRHKAQLKLKFVLIKIFSVILLSLSLHSSQTTVNQEPRKAGWLSWLLCCPLLALACEAFML